MQSMLSIPEGSSATAGAKRRSSALVAESCPDNTKVPSARAPFDVGDPGRVRDQQRGGKLEHRQRDGRRLVEQLREHGQHARRDQRLQARRQVDRLCTG